MSDKPHLNPHIAAAPVYTAGTSVEEVAARYGLTDVIKMASNENALGPSPKAVEAIASALTTLNFYPRVTDDKLRERLAAHVSAGMTPDNFVTSNGGSEMLAMIAMGFLEEGEEAIFCPPTFLLYEIQVRRRGGQPVKVDLTPEYRYDVDAILDAVTSRTRLIYICSPNNPTGTIITQEEADRLMAGVPDHVVVVFDEAYIEFVDHDDHVDSLKYVRDGRHVIVVRTFSKIYGLAGLRVGYAIAPPELAQYLWRCRQPFHLSTLAMTGAMAALEDQEHVARTRAIVIEGRKWLHHQLAEMGLDPVPSQSNFIVFRPGYSPQQVYERLLQRGVVVRPAGPFYMPEHVRVTVGTPEQNERFIAALREVLAEMEELGESGQKAEEGTLTL